MNADARLLLVSAIAVVGLVVLVARCKLNPFIALAAAALAAGLGAGMNPAEVGKVFAAGMGAVLGSIAMVIGLGTFLGKLCAECGAADCVATTLMRAGGERWLPWTILLAAFLIGIPVFFGVGLVLLVPILFTTTRQTSLPFLRLGLPLVAGLSVAHGLVPPHPGPLSAVGLLKADLGKTIGYALLIGLPTAALAGPMLAPWLERQAMAQPGDLSRQLTARRVPAQSPGFGLSLATMILPVGLMLAGTLGNLILPRNSDLLPWLEFCGHPVAALLAATLFAYWSLGRAGGFSGQQPLQLSEECLSPVAQILLVVGAGGGFSQVLIESGAGHALAARAMLWHFSPLWLGWLVAILIRVATGSATVAITTAAGLLAPLALANPGVNRELLVIALGAGSLGLSHVNDGGFWLVKEYLNLSVTQTLKTWTVMETVISLAALVFTLLLNRIL